VNDYHYFVGPHALHLQGHVPFYSEDKDRMCQSTTIYIFSILTLWHITQFISVTQHDAEDVECQIKVTAFISIPYRDLTKNMIFCSSNRAIITDIKWLIQAVNKIKQANLTLHCVTLM